MTFRKPLGLRMAAIATVVAAVLLFGSSASTQVALERVRLGGVASAPILFPDGTSALPAMAFASEPTLGFWRNGAATITVQATTLDLADDLVVGDNATVNGNISVGAAKQLYWASRLAMDSPADGHVKLTDFNATVGSRLKVDALPTIASGFGTSPSVTAGSVALDGSVDVGTGGTATTGVINFNGTAFPSAPFCTLAQSAGTFTTYVSSTTQLTLTAAIAWPASADVTWHCISAK